jgi:hypothetical protein
MAREYEDSVKDQTTSNGPASFTLAGLAPNGYRTPASAHTNGATITLRIENEDNSEWEVADFTINTSTGVVTFVGLHESHTGSQVTFSAGTKAVTEVMPAANLRKPDYTTGSALASAATLNLDNATGGRVHITGTTSITAVTLTHGPRTLIFDGTLTLTHHVTNNNLPGGANITTAAGDRAIYESDGTTVYCVSYIRADGQPVVGSASGLVLLATAEPSNVAAVDFTNIDDTYDLYTFELINVVPATDSAFLLLRTSSNNGSSFDAGASDYLWDNNATQNAIYISDAVSNVTAEGGCSAEVDLMDPANTAVNTTFTVLSVTYGAASAAYTNLFHGACRNSTAAVNAVRFLFSTGNIASGKIKLYGRRKTV